MSKELINPNELFDGAAFGMSQAVVDAESGLVFVSGQVDWDRSYQTSDSTVVGQARSALRNLAIALDAAGSGLEEILQLRIYIRGEISDHIGDATQVLVEFLGGSRPAMTAIGVASLASAETLIEIEAVAKRRATYSF